VFAPGSYFESSPIFASKARSQPVKWGGGKLRLHLQILQKFALEKHSSLFPLFVGDKEKDYNIDNRIAYNFLRQ
jgi:hypothetical protein